LTLNNIHIISLYQYYILTLKQTWCTLAVHKTNITYFDYITGVVTVSFV